MCVFKVCCRRDHPHPELWDRNTTSLLSSLKELLHGGSYLGLSPSFSWVSKSCEHRGATGVSIFACFSLGLFEPPRCCGAHDGDLASSVSHCGVYLSLIPRLLV